MAYERIDDFRGAHHGRNVFILASGPSLGDLDLEPLRRRIVIGLNRSSLLFPQTHYHCTMDDRLFNEYDKVLRRSRYLFTFEDRPFGIPIKLLGSEGFSFDLAKGIYSGYTVSYFALQVAVYMGFKNVFYLGLDLRNRARQTHFFGRDEVSATHEQTEFPKMIRLFQQASDVLEDTDVNVYNCSPDSVLTCFDHMSYKQALET